MKKFICLILVLSLLVSSVGAVEVYEVVADTELIEPVFSPKYQTMASLVGSGASTFAVDSGLTDNQYLWLIAANTEDIWLEQDQFWNTYFDKFDSFVTRFGSLVSTVQLISSEVDLISTKMPDVLTKLDGIDDSVDQVSSYINILMGYVSDVESAVDSVDSSVQSLSPVISALGPYISDFFTDVPGNTFLSLTGFPSTTTSDLTLPYIVRQGFLGVAAQLRVSVNESFLNLNGLRGSVSSDQTLSYLVRHGFLGLQSLVSGSETDNVYSGVSVNNENVSTPFNATGLGPMLNVWLGDIQNDLALLSYVFASPQDLELKKDSESNMDAVSDTILSSDNSSSVKVKDITSISSASDSIQELGETGVTPGQAFEQLGNSDLFSFFSSETAANLDTTVSTYSRDPSQQIVTSFYQDNRFEFFDVIGKEVGW